MWVGKHNGFRWQANDGVIFRGSRPLVIFWISICAYKQPKCLTEMDSNGLKVSGISWLFFSKKFNVDKKTASDKKKHTILPSVQRVYEYYNSEYYNSKMKHGTEKVFWHCISRENWLEFDD